jgi:hypothetical protein
MATCGTMTRVVAKPLPLLLVIPVQMTALTMNSGKVTFLLNPSKGLQYYRLSRYDQQTTCLPYGGPPNPSNPPTGSGCPQSGWYWGEFLSCCLPHYPNPPSPECPEGWQWDAGSYKCSPISTPPNPYNPQPSYGYGDRRRSKRAQQPRTTDLCPSEMTACPVIGNYGVFSDYECIDTAYELQSCGGCSSTGAGQDCTTIRGAWNVGCEYGYCMGAFSIIASVRGLID